MEHLLIFATINLVASILSGASGGGASLVGVPLMILLGLPPATAIATSKFSGLGLATGSSARFYREKLTNRQTVIVFALLGAVGGAVGSTFLVRVGVKHQDVLQHITGYAILVVGIPMLYIRNIGIEQKKRSTPVHALGYVLVFLLVALQAALSSGMGSLQSIVMMACFGMTALTASATRRAMQLIVAVTSLTILLFAGIPSWQFGLVALPTAMLGSFIGAHIAVKKGNKFVINIFAITSFILALQLLWR